MIQIVNSDFFLFTVSKQKMSTFDCLIQLEDTLKFIAEPSRRHHFSFWFNAFKTKVFPFLFPQIALDVGITQSLGMLF